MDYTEDKMIDTFVRRYKKSKDIVTETRIAMKFIELHGLSVFRFTKYLGGYDKDICNKFIKALEVD